MSLTNLGSEPREIEVTSYAELVLAPPARRRRASGLLQPLRADRGGRRSSTRSSPRARPRVPTRSASGPPTWWRWRERARAARSTRPTASRFLGRGRGIRTPMSMIEGRPLSNTTGAVLDPDLQPAAAPAPGAGRERAHRVLHRCSPTSRPAALLMADKYRDPATFERIATLAWTQAQVQLHHLGHRRGGGAPLPAGRQSHPLRRSAACARPPPSLARNTLGPSGALGAPDLRRSAHRAGPHRRGRGPRDRAPAPARPRVLAHEGARGRSRHPQREAAVVSAGSPGGARGPGPDRAGPRSARPRRARSFVLRGDLLVARRARLPERGRARDPAEPPGHPRRAGGARRAARAALPRRRERRARARRGRPCPSRSPPRPRAGVRQRAGRLRGGRPRVHDRARRGPVDAGARGST